MGSSASLFWVFSVFRWLMRTGHVYEMVWCSGVLGQIALVKHRVLICLSDRGSVRFTTRKKALEQQLGNRGGDGSVSNLLAAEA